jgi:hypothetical protein
MLGEHPGACTAAAAAEEGVGAGPRQTSAGLPAGLGGIPRLTDAVLRAIAASPCATRLRHLYASDLPRVTAEGVAALLAGCPALCGVALEHCAQLSAADVARLGVTPYVFIGDMLPQEAVRACNPFLAAVGAR